MQNSATVSQQTNCKALEGVVDCVCVMSASLQAESTGSNAGMELQQQFEFWQQAPKPSLC